MKVLITGANGFIGRNLVESMKNRYTVCAPMREELDLFDEAAVYSYVRRNVFDIVIHCANVNNVKNRNITPYDILSGNLRMFFNLILCKEYYGKMYYFGSGAEYDMRYYIPKMKEDYYGKHVPKDAYGFSKYVMSRICDAVDCIYDLRLFGVYGKYEEWERRFISNAICRALKGKPITIQKNVYFDYLWIDDLCDIVRWFVEHEPLYKHYNVCSGKRIDLYTLANIVRKVLDIDCDIVVKEPGWKLEYTGNNDRLLQEMGNYRFTEYKRAIQELCEYYVSNIDIIEAEKLL